MLVMTDVFSKYTVAVLTHDQRASTVAKILVSEWFYKFGVPAHQHSDQGRNFERNCYIFNQEPRLPKDVFLGRVEKPTGGTVHHLVQEHQARL